MELEGQCEKTHAEVEEKEGRQDFQVEDGAMQQVAQRQQQQQELAQFLGQERPGEQTHGEVEKKEG